MPPAEPVQIEFSREPLDALLATLEVRFVRLSECLMERGYRLLLQSCETPGLHYVLQGHGEFRIGDDPPVPIKPHTLIIAPAHATFSFAAPDPETHVLRTVDRRTVDPEGGEVRRNVAGSGSADLLVICGCMRATYGDTVDLFALLDHPIVEQFSAIDEIENKLGEAFEELRAQEIGAGAMSGALIKQVLVTLLRRSLRSQDLWVERFALLNDPQMARTLAAMVANLGADHRVETLAHTAGLSRAAFVKRFTPLFGMAPMTLLRALRMRKAARLLVETRLSVNRIGEAVGYTHRSSFIRAFNAAFHCDPSPYRAQGRRLAAPVAPDLDDTQHQVD